jgi:hypothetical protein
MNAQLKEGGLPVAFSVVNVFDKHGHRVSDYQEPKVTLDPEVLYGSITSRYTNDIREQLAQHLDAYAIAVSFTKITEGRPYSVALRLRELGYGGELHAVGAVNKELIHHLVRVGFTHIHLQEQVGVIATEIVSPFSHAYQSLGVAA